MLNKKIARKEKKWKKKKKKWAIAREKKAQMDILNNFSNSEFLDHFHVTQYTLNIEKVLTESKLRNWLPRGKLRHQKII